MTGGYSERDNSQLFGGYRKGFTWDFHVFFVKMELTIPRSRYGKQENMMKKLQRSRKNKVFFGVCGGIAEHLGLDPVVVRLVFILVTLFGGMGVLAYIIGVIIIPESSEAEVNKTEPADNLASTYIPPSQAPVPKRDKSGEVIGLTLIAFGIFFLLRKIEAFDRYFDWISYHFWSILVPAIFVVLGISLIMRTRKND